MADKRSYHEIEGRNQELLAENSCLKHNLGIIRSILDDQTGFYILINKAGNVIDANQAISGYLGISHEDFEGSCLWDCFPQGSSKLTKELADEVFASGKPMRFEDKHDHLWYDIVLYPVLNDSDRPEEIAILAHDITGHKQVEGLLSFQRDLGMILSSSLKLEEMLTSILESLFRVDGIDAGGIYGKDASTGDLDLIVHQGIPGELVQPLSHFNADSIHAGLVNKGKPVYWDIQEARENEIPLRRTSGFKGLCILPIVSEGAVIASLFLLSHELDDITTSARIALETVAEHVGSVINRIRAEELLQKYELIVSTVHNPMSFIDRSYTYQAVNNAYLSAFNRPRPWFIGKKVRDVFGSAVFSEKLKTHLDRAFSGKEAHFEEWIDYPGWGRRFNSLSYYPLFSHDGSITGVAAISRDITERKKTEELLMESESRYRTLFESATDPIMILKQDIIDDHNRKTCEMFGINGHDPARLSITMFFPPQQPDGEESSKKWGGLMRKALHERSQFFEWCFVRRDGSRFDAEVSLSPFEIRGAYYVQAIIRDITERKLRDEENMRVGKLETISTLSGGIAHDFNNLLATILGNIELAMLQLSPQHQASVRLDKALEACNRSKDLLRQFLTLSKGGIVEKKKASIKSLISDSVTLALTGTRMPCTCSIPDELWMIEFNENQMMHALHNIIKNARESMPSGGSITISARNAVLESYDTDYGSLLKPGPHVIIDIIDQGVGIPEENREKIFDPYFSTKDKGPQKGMGLGLATAYSIITKHGGNIEVESEVGTGTTVHIYLPALPTDYGDHRDKASQRIIGADTSSILFPDENRPTMEAVPLMLQQEAQMQENPPFTATPLHDMRFKVKPTK